MSLSEALHTLNKEKKYLVAISGGVDSMVLLHLFRHTDTTFSVVHCNFQLRGEDSEKDEQLVKEYCRKYGLELFTCNFDTKALKKNRESIEMIARTLRYDFFNELIHEYSFDYLVTAHHLNDNAETFFINLLRGSGLKGLAGMQVYGDHVLRPLLPYSRAEILDFAVSNSIIWREDHTNQSLEYLRNKIRHKIIPELEDINSSSLYQIEKSMKIINSSFMFIEGKVKELEEKACVSNESVHSIFSREELKKAELLLIYHFFSKFGFTHEQDGEKILEAKTGSVFVSDTHKIWVNREQIIIESQNSDLENSEISVFIEKLPFELEVPFHLKINSSDEKPEGSDFEIIDYDKVSFPLHLRNWKEGDYFYPINGKGKKKISKYLKDEKVSGFDKKRVYVLCDNSGDIIWLLGFRLDDRFKVTSQTRQYIYSNKI